MFSKWLNLIKVVKDTTNGSNTKWDTLTKVRAINKLNYQFQLPVFEILQVVSYEVPVVCYQYNFTLPEDFTILNWQDIRNYLSDPTNEINYYLCIRYREGFDLTRYKLMTTGSDSLSAPLYSGEIIKGNFVLEVWSRSGNDEIERTVSNPNIVNFNSSITLDPVTDSGVNPIIAPVSEATGHTHSSLGTLFNALPSNNPAVYNAVGPFSDNV